MSIYFFMCVCGVCGCGDSLTYLVGLGCALVYVCSGGGFLAATHRYVNHLTHSLTLHLTNLISVSNVPCGAGLLSAVGVWVVVCRCLVSLLHFLQWKTAGKLHIPPPCCYMSIICYPSFLLCVCIRADRAVTPFTPIGLARINYHLRTLHSTIALLCVFASPVCVCLGGAVFGGLLGVLTCCVRLGFGLSFVGVSLILLHFLQWKTAGNDTSFVLLSYVRGHLVMLSTILPLCVCVQRWTPL